MRSKSVTTFLNRQIQQCSIRFLGTMSTQYSRMVNRVNACQLKAKALSKNLMENKAGAVLNTIEDKLKVLSTYHSLKLTDEFSLTLEDVIYLLKENNTLDNKEFLEQLKVFNLYRILDYCTQYQKVLMASGWENPSSAWPNNPDEYILFALDHLAEIFVLMFHEGLGSHFDVMHGTVQPAGALYFVDRPEYEHVKKGSDLLLQTIKQRTDDPFINAAKIHNELAKGHQFDKKFGLLFCRLHMNFALMLAGYSLAIIDSSHKEEYLKIVTEDKLDDPQPLATFLVKNLINTYQDYILPDLEAEALNKNIQAPFQLGRQSSNVNEICEQDGSGFNHSVKKRQ